MKCWEQVDL